MPSIDVDKLTHQHLLRSMDALMDHQGAVDDCVAHLLRPLIDEDRSVVFYDLTTIRAEGLSQQDGDVRHFGMSKEGVIARQFMLGVVQTADGMPIFHEVSEAHLARIIKVDLQSDLFTYAIAETALARAQIMDGKLMLVTNVRDMTAADVVTRYKSLADIERGFRVLKSEIEIAPVFHRLPERIKAHASICFMALILYRVMRQCLKLAGSELSPEAALADLRRIQRHAVRIDSGAPIHGVSTVQPRQADVLGALKINKPTYDAQMSLL